MGWKPTDEFFNRGFDDVKDLVEHWKETYGADKDERLRDWTACGSRLAVRNCPRDSAFGLAWGSRKPIQERHGGPRREMGGCG